ncbi:MAG: glutamine--fructose-6-phosphate transaminase (isomerizing), partial [Candidatus Thermoplasmatota archaeon]|nr:glutamine--fructose-6-phosphate transaminase (isomerizing) [Candidatus Thermoplasmatota archaeon]
MQGLKHLEYRGYDSAGIAVVKNKEIEIVKSVGEIKKLESALSAKDYSKVQTAVGHTRWATHGAPSTINSHPHPDCKGTLGLVHNGIIENYMQLKNALIAEGHVFKSQTDTEVASHLIEKHYSGDALAALQKALQEIRGSYAFAFVHRDYPDKIFFARCQSPLIVGLGKGMNLIASDVPAVLAYTRKVIYLEDGDYGYISKDGFEIYNSGLKVERKISEVSWSVEDAQKGGFPHFMLKEIFENPRAISETLLSRISLSPPYSSLDLPEEVLRSAKRFHIVACGTSYHAGLVGKHAIEPISGTPVQVDVASEQRYSFIDDDEVFVYITQSGETADTLACAREAKRRGKTTIAITNVVGSTITRECTYSIMMCAGPEKGVAATKTYTSQIVTLYV